MPERIRFSKRSVCPVANTLDVLGDKWTLLVVRDMLLLGKRRFGELLQADEGIPTNILAERLRRLEEDGILRRRAYRQHPARDEYVLTKKGADLFPLLREIVRWANRYLPGTATDISLEILDLAGAQIAGSSCIRLLHADARTMPFANHSFDIVTCSLALHHFVPGDAVLVLREMDRLCRAGFIVNDLRRGAAAYGATWLATRLTTRNRLTRHDAPLSIQRAYTPGELRSLLNEANVRDAEIRTVPWFRMVAVKRAAYRRPDRSGGTSSPVGAIPLWLPCSGVTMSQPGAYVRRKGF